MEKLSGIENELVRSRIHDVSDVLSKCSTRTTLLIGEAYTLKPTMASFTNQGLLLQGFGIPKMGWVRLLPIPKAKNFVVSVSNPKAILSLFDVLDDSPLQMMIISVDSKVGELCLHEAMALRSDIWFTDKMLKIVEKFPDSFAYEINTDSSRFDGTEETVHWNVETPLDLLRAAGISSGQI